MATIHIEAISFCCANGIYAASLVKREAQAKGHSVRVTASRVRDGQASLDGSGFTVESLRHSGVLRLQAEGRQAVWIRSREWQRWAECLEAKEVL